MARRCVCDVSPGADVSHAVSTVTVSCKEKNL